MKNTNFDFSGECHGVTTVGERGQVVIPHDVRQSLRLKQKDKLFVFSKLGRMIILIKAKDLQKFFDSMLPKGTPFKIVKKSKK